MFLLAKLQKIGKYTITFPIKEGEYAETYRVKDEDGKNYFMKLIYIAKLHKSQFDEKGNVLGISIAKQLNHENLIHYHDSGSCMIEGQQIEYVLFDYISGETIAKRMLREQEYDVFDAKQIAIGILNGLKFLHTLPEPIIHTDLTIQNVMLDLSTNTIIPKIIDFGYARYLNQKKGESENACVDPYSMATETYNGDFSIQSDLFSVGAILYQMIFGVAPWFVDMPYDKKNRDKFTSAILNARQNQLRIPDSSIVKNDAQLINILGKSMAFNVEDRFQSADEFIKALKGEIEVKPIVQSSRVVGKPKGKVGNGFADVAGMQELKDKMQEEVIDVLHSPDIHKEYGITIPNGMLLYGPPGCGKTFFAKRFAEEVGFNFMYITPSTLKSKYVNATQENIAQMFDEAEKNAPTIIFIDEINELVPNRDSEIHEMAKSAVNEMLAQMDRTGEMGVFIIGATNYPNMIDPAMLRAGRIEKKYYVGPPDQEARVAMFELYLRNRPIDNSLDYEKLAILTKNYVSSDIELIVNDSARVALKSHSKITMDILENIIAKTEPSVSLAELQKFENIRLEMENTNKGSKHSRIGFKK